jgi:hypothetical protein
LRGHVGGSFYTGEVVRVGEIRKAKFGERMSNVVGKKRRVRERERKRKKREKR